jgi:hypothetical protein
MIASTKNAIAHESMMFIHFVKAHTELASVVPIVRATPSI